MLVYGSPHDPDNTHPDTPPVAEGHAPFTLTEASPPDSATLTAALRSASAASPGPLDTLTLVIPATQCHITHRTFPSGVSEAEAHTLAAQMATQIAAERGHTAPLAFDWQRRNAHEIALCLAPRALIANYLEAVQAAGMRCVAITPGNDSAPDRPAAAPFNLIPWRNTAWLRLGRTRILCLAATTLFIITAAALIAHSQGNREQALSAQHTQMQNTLKTRQAQLPDLAKLRQQLATQRATQHANQAAHEAAQRQQQTWAARLNQLARTRPQGIRYHSLSYDPQEMRLEGLAQTPAALTRLLKALPCPHLSEGHRDAHGPLHFTLQLPATCQATP